MIDFWIGNEMSSLDFGLDVSLVDARDIQFEVMYTDHSCPSILKGEVPYPNRKPPASKRQNTSCQNTLTT
jgi:hypothetical protein